MLYYKNNLDVRMRSGVVRGHRQCCFMGIDGESKERNNRVWKRIQALHVYMIPSWIIFLTKNGCEYLTGLMREYGVRDDWYWIWGAVPGT